MATMTKVLARLDRQKKVFDRMKRRHDVAVARRQAALDRAVGHEKKCARAIGAAEAKLKAAEESRQKFLGRTTR